VPDGELMGNQGLKQRRGWEVTWLAVWKMRGEGVT
jgi:hypothetical protein